MKVLNLSIFIRTPDSGVINLNGLFRENAEILAKNNNCEQIENVFNMHDGDTVFIFGAHSCPSELLYYKRNKQINYVIIQTENVESIVFKNRDYIKLLRDSKVWDWSYYNKNVLQTEYNVNVDNIYDFKFYKMENDGCDRPIDLFFCGGGNAFRQKILDRIQKEFPHLKCKFLLNYNLSDNNELTKILKLCKVVLNIPFHQPSALATHRINKAIACGCQVFSIPSCDKILDNKYKDIINFDKNLSNLIRKKFNKQEKSDNFNQHILEQNF